MDDDAALLKAANAQWAVVPLTDEGRSESPFPLLSFS